MREKREQLWSPQPCVVLAGDFLSCTPFKVATLRAGVHVDAAPSVGDATEAQSVVRTGDGFARLMQIAALLTAGFVALLALLLVLNRSSTPTAPAASPSRQSASVSKPATNEASRQLGRHQLQDLRSSTPDEREPSVSLKATPAPTRARHLRASKNCVRMYRAGSEAQLECAP